MPDVNQKISSLLSYRDQLSDKEYLVFETKILKAYKQALVNVKSKIAEMYMKYGDKVTLSEMQSYKRLDNLQKQLQQQINILNGNVTRLTRTQIKTFFEQNFYLTGYAFETATGIDGGFGLLNPRVIEEAVANPYNWEGRLKLWNEKLLGDIQNNVVQGLAQGQGLSVTTKNIQASFETNLGIKKANDIKRSNILRVVRTESTRAQSMGNQAGYKKAFEAAERLGVNIDKVWDATFDNRTRLNHGDMDGKKANDDGLFLFTTMKGEKILVPGPHLTNTPDDIACRCTERIQIKGLEPKERMDNETKKLISYRTFNQWYEGRAKK